MRGRGGFERHLEILHTVAETVGRSLDVEEVLRTALDALTHVTGHEIASLHLLSEDGRTLHLRGERGLSPELRNINRVLSVGHGLIGGVAATGKTLNVNNAAQSPNLLPAAKRAVQKERQRAFLCVPIHCRGRILGTLSLGRQTSQSFGEREVALVEATADQIGIALDNARLYSESLRQLDELKRAQAQLIHAEKLSAVGELASGVAHEINNPLTTILGQAQLLLDRADVTPHVRDRLTIVSDEAARAARIVQNLLLFSRHYPPERRPCSLADQARRVLELKAYQLQSDKIEVETDFEEECPPVWADENQVQQVLLNLVQNAHQAMAREDERVLTVRVRPLGAAVAVEVLDTGPGIPAELLPRVFDPFFTTKPPGEGSGLGLSVSYGIVAEHKGTLRGDNRPDRRGAVFTIELPIGEAS
jgi:two-component system NtrC family sensor kinase